MAWPRNVLRKGCNNHLLDVVLIIEFQTRLLSLTSTEVPTVGLPRRVTASFGKSPQITQSGIENHIAIHEPLNSDTMLSGMDNNRTYHIWYLSGVISPCVLQSLPPPYSVQPQSPRYRLISWL